MWESADGQALTVVVIVVVLANLLYLSGLFVANPLGMWNGLGAVTKPGLLAGLPTIDPSNGITSQAFGHRAMLDLLHLHIPWWNPYEGTGSPLAGDMLSGALFPFTIFTLMANGQVYERLALELVAGAATYMLLRRLDVGRWAATAAAIAFALDGTFSWFAHAPINVIAFLPLLLLGLEIAFDASGAGRRGGWWLIAIALALSLYAGFPETAYIDSLLVVLWFLWRCGCANREYLRAFVTKAVLGAVAGLLLAAPVLVAFAGYEPHTYTAHASDVYANLHLAHAALPQLILPYVYGPIFGFSDANGELSGIWGSVGGYLSISLVLSALLGLCSPGRRGLRIILFAWIVLALSKIYGAPGLDKVIGVLPAMGQVAFLRYAQPSVEFAVIVLAALGIDSLVVQRGRRIRVVGAALVSLAIVAAAAIGATTLVHRLPESSHRAYSQTSVIYAVAVLAVGAVAGLLRRTRARLVVAAALVSIDAVVMFVVPQLSAPRHITINDGPVRYLQRHLGLSRFVTLGPLATNYGTYYGLRAINVNDALMPSDVANYVTAHLDSGVNPLIFIGTSPGRPPGDPTPEQELLSHLNGYRDAGVRYVLAPTGLELPLGPHAFKIVYRGATTLIYRLSDASPYFTATRPGCTVKAHSDESATVSCTKQTMLVRRETYLPGWTAEVDGDSTTIKKHEGTFQSVTVGPGTHHVTFGYAPPHIDLALFGFAAGWLLLIVPPLVARRRTRGNGLQPLT